MTIAYSCIFIAALIPYFYAGYAKFSVKGYNNSEPREFLNKLEGKGKRANYAQNNSFEAFPAFAVSIITAQIAGVSTEMISILAVLFVLFRVLYGIFYIQNQPTLRSIVWFAGFFCVITLFVKSILNIS